MKKLGYFVVLSMAMILLLAACGTAQEAPENNDTAAEEDNSSESKSITIGVDNFSYAKVPTYLSKVILEDQGYDVKINEAAVGVLFASLAQGDIDAFVDIWSPYLHGPQLEEYGDQFEIVGTLYPGAHTGIAVPKYVEIDSLDQLNDMKEEFDKTIYGLEKGTGTNKLTIQTVEEYNLDYEIVNSAEPAMLAQAQKLMEQEKPVAFIGWHPHPMFQQMDIKLLEDPKDIWRENEIQIGSPPDLQERLPEAYTLFSNMKLSIEEVEDWQLKMSEGADAEELAEEWVKENADTVDEWLTP